MTAFRHGSISKKLTSRVKFFRAGLSQSIYLEGAISSAVGALLAGTSSGKRKARTSSVKEVFVFFTIFCRSSSTKGGSPFKSRPDIKYEVFKEDLAALRRLLIGIKEALPISNICLGERLGTKADLVRTRLISPMPSISVSANKTF